MKLQKRMATLAMAIVALIATPACLFAQTAEVQENVDYKTVLSDYIEATGGEAAHKALKTLEASGQVSIEAAGIEGKLYLAQSDNKAYMKMEIPGLGEHLVGYDGETAWQISEMTGPEILEGEQKDQMVQQMAVSPFLNAADQYESIECTGTEEFNGEDCYVLVMKNEDQEPVYNYFSVESHLLLGTKMTQAGPMGNMEVVSKVGDYKEVGDVKLSHSTTVELPGGMGSMVTTIDSMKANGEVDKTLFDLPEEIKELQDDS